MIETLHKIFGLSRLVLVSAALLASAVVFAQEPAVQDLLVPAREPSARAALGVLRGDEIRERAVRLDTATLERAARAGGSWAARLPLFDDQAAQLLLTAQPASDPDATTWTGYLLDDANSTVVATYRAGQLVADVFTSTGSYRVRPTASGVHRLIQVDAGRAQPELAPVAVDPMEQAGDRFLGLDFGGGGGDNANGATDLDLLFAYTSRARKAGGGPSAIESQVLNMVAWLNLSLANNGQKGRARVVGIVPTDYVGSSADLLESLEALHDGEGALRALHDERDRLGADIVVLLQEEGNGCGLSYLMQSPSSSFASYAFSVVLRECTTSLAHEVGHLLGAQHEAESATVAGLYSYSYGAVAPKAGWRTTMATGRACLAQRLECPRIPYFSDPAATFHGDALGDAAASDNARTLASTWATAAAFRRPTSSLEGPRRLRLRGRNGRVVLKWKGSRAADSYQVLRSTDGGELETIGRVGGQAKRFIDRKVNLRTTGYCYQVAVTAGSAQAIAGPVCIGR